MTDWTVLERLAASTVSDKAQYTVVGASQSHSQQWDFDTAHAFGIYALIFGFAVFAIMAFLLMRGHQAYSVLKICALPLVIISAVYLIIVGYSEQQIAPVLSLLSAIAGYLLGNSASDSNPSPPPAQTNGNK